MRTLPLNFRKAMHGQSTSEVAAILLTFSPQPTFLDYSVTITAGISGTPNNYEVWTPHTWAPNVLKGRELLIVSGPNAGLSRTIESNTVDSISVYGGAYAFPAIFSTAHTFQVLPAQIRVSTDNGAIFTIDSVDYRGTISGGHNYIFLPIRCQLPDDTDSIPEARIVLDNVDQRIIQILRSITAPPTVRMAVVLASDPNTEILQFDGMTMSGIEYDTTTISATLSYDSFLNEPYPGGQVLPSSFPGQFS